jgi:hypothetical protein
VLRAPAWEGVVCRDGTTYVQLGISTGVVDKLQPFFFGDSTGSQPGGRQHVLGVLQFSNSKKKINLMPNYFGGNNVVVFSKNLIKNSSYTTINMPTSTSITSSTSSTHDRIQDKTPNPNMTAEPQPSRKRTILSEEEYVSSLTGIVTRDFYPSIPSLQRDVAVLDCRSRGDVMGAIAIRRMARATKIADETTSRTITEFHQSSTSEDNAEFENNQQEEIKLHAQQIHELYYQQRQQRLQKIRSDTNKVMITEESKLASDLFQGDDNTNKIQHLKDLPLRNSLFFYPSQEDYETNKKKLSTLLLTTNNSNHLMIQQQDNNNGDDVDNNNNSSSIKNTNAFEESSRIPTSSIKEVVATSEATTSSSSNIIQEEEKKKKIQYSQTRFPYQSYSRLPPPTTTIHNKTLFLDKIDVDSDTDLDATPLSSISTARKERATMLSKELNTFLPMTPLRAPSVVLPISTNRKSSNHPPPPSFTNSRKWTSAAQKLLQRTTTTPAATNARMGSAFRSALQSTYTPQLPPASSSSSSNSNRNRKVSSSTPRTTAVSTLKGRQANPSQGLNTNGLLHLS